MWSLPSRERGLKYYFGKQNCRVGKVAPFAGAWIEMNSSISARLLCEASLPSRERGLKCTPAHRLILRSASLPSRERGLK